MVWWSTGAIVVVIEYHYNVGLCCCRLVVLACTLGVAVVVVVTVANIEPLETLVLCVPPPNTRSRAREAKSVTADIFLGLI